MSTTDIAALCRRLKTLGTSPPTQEARAELLEGMASKWDGVVVTSARALSKWGDPQSISAIRDVLARKAKLPDGWATAGALTAALARHMRSADVTWAASLVLRDSNPHYRSNLFQLLLFTPKGQTLRELKKFEGAAGVNPSDLRRAITLVEMHSHNNAA